MSDSFTAINLLRANQTFAAVLGYYREGLLSDREYRRYLEAWTWSAPRFTGDAGRRQDRYFEMPDGEAILRRRINRMRRFLGFAVYLPV